MTDKQKTLAALEKTNIATASTQELKVMLTQSMAITARYVQVLANIWQELESRGEDLTELRTGLTRYFPMISSGKLDSNLVIKYAGHQLLLRELALMPIDEQRRLMNGEKVALVTTDNNGDFKTDMVDVSGLHARHYPLLFDMGILRTEREQKAYLKKIKKRKSKSSKIRKKIVTYSSETESIKCGTQSILIDDVLSALSKENNISVEKIKKYLKLENENNG